MLLNSTPLNSTPLNSQGGGNSLLSNALPLGGFGIGLNFIANSTVNIVNFLPTGGFAIGLNFIAQSLEPVAILSCLLPISSTAISSKFLIFKPNLYTFPALEIVSISYQVTFSGYENNIDDFTIPVSNISGNVAIGPSSLFLSIANTNDNLIEITKREKGTFQVQAFEEYKDGSRASTKWDKYLFSITLNSGATRSSITINGSLSGKVRQARAIILQNIKINTGSGTGFRVRASTNKDIRPEDIAIVNGLSFKILRINYVINDSQKYITVSG